MMRYFVELGLFENSQGTITCLKLARRLDKSMTSNPEMRSIIENLKNHDDVMTKSENIMQDKIRLDKNKDIDQSKIARKKLEEEAFEYWWKRYPTKTAKKAAFKSWQKIVKKMDDQTVKELTNHIVSDVETRLSALNNGDDRFIGFDRLHPTTYLNQERYNDDI